MAAFGPAARNMPVRVPAAGLRFTAYAILSVCLMYLDQGRGWLEAVRYTLQAAAYPIQLAVNSPTAGWRWLQESFTTRGILREENVRLREENRRLQLQTLRFTALQQENAQLRGLQEALPPVAQRWLIAEVVSVEMNSLRQRLLINRGTRNGVFRGQAVLDGRGLIGQTTRVGPWSAEIILITDPEHAVPVQIARNGLRTIAVGAGDAETLALPYLPANADVQKGDLLITSGLGGVFPHGYPVGRVEEVHRDAVQALAQVRARPLAALARDREVMLVWFREAHPAAPVRAVVDEDLPTGNPKVQPRPHTPPPAPAPIAPTPAPTRSTPTPEAPAPAPASSPATAAPETPPAETGQSAANTSPPATEENEE